MPWTPKEGLGPPGRVCGPLSSSFCLSLTSAARWACGHRRSLLLRGAWCRLRAGRGSQRLLDNLMEHEATPGGQILTRHPAGGHVDAGGCEHHAPPRSEGCSGTSPKPSGTGTRVGWGWAQRSRPPRTGLVGGGGTAEPIKPGFTPEILDFLHPTQPSCQFFLALGRSGGGRGPTRREKGGAAGAGGFLPD